MDSAARAQIFASLCALADAETTAMAPTEMVNTTREYVDDEYLARERSVLVERYPIIVGRASQVPSPGDFLTADLGGVPTLVVRQADESVRAFLNVCRHRGAELCSAEAGHARLFTCPFHAWSYGTNGGLRSIPYDDGFAGLDRAQYGLLALPVEERHGFVWVVPSPGASIDVAEHLGALDVELAGWDLSSYVHERGVVLCERLNWKLVIDGFLELYHLRFLHRNSVGAYIRTNLSTFDSFGIHGRLIGVRPGFDANRSMPFDDEEFLRQIVVVYQLFPNTILVWQADHFESWTVFPGQAGAASSVSRVSLIAPHETRSDEEQQLWDKNWKILMDTVVEEDFAMATSIQRSFDTGLLAQSVFGRNEPALQHFHQQLHATVGALQPGAVAANRSGGIVMNTPSASARS